jgi:hypothetical protein
MPKPKVIWKERESERETWTKQRHEKLARRM